MRAFSAPDQVWILRFAVMVSVTLVASACSGGSQCASMGDEQATALTDKVLLDPVGSTGEIFGHRIADLQAKEVRRRGGLKEITVGYVDKGTGSIGVVMRIFENCDVEYLEAWPSY